MIFIKKSVCFFIENIGREEEEKSPLYEGSLAVRSYTVTQSHRKYCGGAFFSIQKTKKKARG